MKSKYKHRLNGIIRLRKLNRIEEAVSIFNDLFRFFSDDASLLAEGVRLCLLSGENEQAYQFYLKCRELKNLENFLEWECLLRLKISLGQIPIAELDSLQTKDSPKWYLEFEQTGNDPLYELTPESCAVSCTEGKVDYNFAAKCKSCDYDLQIVIGLTFLVYREFLCPVCFAKLSFDYEAIKGFVETKMPRQFSKHLIKLDDKFINLQNELTLDSVVGEQFPLLCRYLNQDYLFLLNQIIFNKLNPELGQKIDQ